MVRVKGWGGTTEQGNSACTESPIWEGSPALAQPERVRRVPWNKDTEDVHAPPVRVVGREGGEPTDLFQCASGKARIEGP